jgi:hypothetical protein
MDHYEISETTEEWRVRVTCSPEEVAAVAASVPKMLAGMTGCYQPDNITIHQALQAAAEAQALPPARNRLPAYVRN